ncbi:hypothetical protein [Falsihalocynthiibacter arcticus]|uniref:Alpha 1,4-glycosyltransferase domain-containing protein n=1 Tax=Falsihalocynthiibacter arcticus TaxID=1579316 RepID=A0A126UYS3_9RHOB|nr:hypothetical protein [Falsihalocynthiibacter arcticus]AML51194.1 hypothetical protein RC74_07930 [Falsihalocynthiibacter arcticus]
MAKLPEIASLWIGGQLSWLEQLCLVSFAHAGHKVTLYSYSPIPNCPAEVEQLPADPIFAAEPMLRHARTGSPAIHADLFRLNMLQHTGKIWVDADMYCYQPFDFHTPMFLAGKSPASCATLFWVCRKTATRWGTCSNFSKMNTLSLPGSNHGNSANWKQSATRATLSI